MKLLACVLYRCFLWSGCYRPSSTGAACILSTSRNNRAHGEDIESTILTPLWGILDKTALDHLLYLDTELYRGIPTNDLSAGDLSR